MTTLTIGILPFEEMKARTLAIARGKLNVLPDDPKNWLPSTGTLGKILSGPNRALRPRFRETRRNPSANSPSAPAASSPICRAL
jgi:predicted transcriptional regulator